MVLVLSAPSFLGETSEKAAPPSFCGDTALTTPPWLAGLASDGEFTALTMVCVLVTVARATVSVAPMGLSLLEPRAAMSEPTLSCESSDNSMLPCDMRRGFD